MKWNENMGKMLKQERKSWGMSKKRLSKLAFVDIYTIEDIENGLIKNPSFYDMLNICEALDTSVYFYLDEKCEGSYYGKRRKLSN